MYNFKWFVWLCFPVLVSFVLADEGELLKPCPTDDMVCIRSTTQQFLENTAMGKPEYDFRAIDPMIIPSLDYDVGYDLDITHRLKDLNVTGLKNLLISDFKMNKTAKAVQLTMLLEANIIGHITVEYHKHSKSFSGDYSSYGKVKAVSDYPYDLAVDSEGIEHFVMGMEKTTYEIEESPVITIGDKLRKELENDITITDNRKEFLDKLPYISKMSMEKMMDVAVPTLMHNLRQAAKLMPKTAFFKD